MQAGIAKSMDDMRQNLAEYTQAVSNQQASASETLSKTAADLRQAGSEKLRLCLDVGHANTMVSKEPVAVWLEKCAPYLAHVHVHNNDGAMDLHQPLDDGVLDMKDILTRLGALAPQAGVTLELMQCRSSVEWLLEQRLLQ